MSAHLPDNRTVEPETGPKGLGFGCASNVFGGWYYYWYYEVSKQ
jgi:hypothetical protein